MELDGCNSRCGFWQRIAYTLGGCLLGILTGAAPMVFKDYATVEYVDTKAPWSKAEALYEEFRAKATQKLDQHDAALATINNSVGSIEGKLDFLIQATEKKYK